ncbi:MAG: hypothetical protein IPN95_30415 [Bacteroidetes bacterium]|nr:hypothetical protein [Bacteroidota bacterium]
MSITPQHFYLETDQKPSQLTAIQDIEAMSNSLSLGHQPIRATWYRLSALPANSEVVLTNAVEFAHETEMRHSS